MDWGPAMSAPDPSLHESQLKTGIDFGDELLRNPRWTLALTMHERVEQLRSRCAERQPVRVDDTRARQRVEQWRSQHVLGTAAELSDPVELHRCTEEEFGAILGEDSQELRAAPSWLQELHAAYFSSSEDRRRAVPRRPPRRRLNSRFGVVVERPIEVGVGRLCRRALRLRHSTPSAPFEPDEAAGVLLNPLLLRLDLLLSGPLVVELHAARLSGELAGRTPSSRFQAFLSKLETPQGAFRVFLEYPVLARLVATALEDWLKTSTEFLGRLCADWEALVETFGLEASDRLADIEVVGDRHRQGRAVIVATFTSGVKIVYKPRPMAVDRHFQHLVRWVNQRLDHPQFRVIAIVDRGAYGWAEFVEQRPCQTEQELRRFYRRHGAYLALLYALAAVDCHYENVIAAGEHPVVVDLESLFHTHSPSRAGLSGVDRVAAASVNRSVLRVGLLPRCELVGDDIVDLTGMGAFSGQQVPIPVPDWEKTGTDVMHRVLRRGENTRVQSQPSERVSHLELVRFADDVVIGFSDVYKTLERDREFLLSEDGLVRRFADDITRCILRPTYEYGLLLQSSYHPHFLTDGLNRDRRFDRLLGRSEAWPEWLSIVDAERTDLWRGDIPLFATRPRSRHLWTSSGDRIPDFLAESGLEVVTNRLQDFSREDLERQCWMIRAAISAASFTSESMAFPACIGAVRDRPAEPRELVEAATAVGDRLAALAIRSSGEATWIGIKSREGAVWWVDPVGCELYDGLAGVALFLAYLAEITASDHFYILAREAAASFVRQLESEGAMLGIGAFSGLAGPVYALAHLASLWNEPELLGQALRLSRQVRAGIAVEGRCDVVAGLAGAIVPLLHLFRLTRERWVLQAAIDCGDRLVHTAIPMEEGVAWPPPVPTWPPLGGFAHGATGIAWSLLELASAASERPFLDAALGGMAYERTLFSHKIQNWRDLRELPRLLLSQQTSEGNFMSHWCHGSAGIGLARIAALRTIDDDVTAREAEVAIRTTLRTGFGTNHSLCHGDLGNADLLLVAQAAGLSVRREETIDLASRILASIEMRGPLSGLPLGTESPGMMMGLSGIGYGLLRLAEPQRVPSVLLLEPPLQLPPAPGRSPSPAHSWW